MPCERQRRPALVAFGGVVVNHVQDDFEPGVVEPRDHLLELAKTLFRRRGVTRIRCEKADAVIAPIVLQPAFQQVAVH